MHQTKTNSTNDVQKELTNKEYSNVSSNNSTTDTSNKSTTPIKSTSTNDHTNPSSSNSNNQSSYVQRSYTYNNYQNRATKNEISKDPEISNNGTKLICHECQYQATTGERMETHIKRHHRQEGLFECSKCGHATAYEGMLVRHMKKKHNIDYKYSWME